MLVKSIHLEGDESLVDGGSSSQGSLLSMLSQVTGNMKVNWKENMKCRLFVWLINILSNGTNGGWRIPTTLVIQHLMVVHSDRIF